MTNRLAAAIAAGMLAIGLLTGAAGAVLIAGASSPSTTDYSAQMINMHEAMDGVVGSGMMGAGGVHMPFRSQHHANGQP